MPASLKSKRGAFTLVELMIVITVIGLLTAIAVPSFVRAREVSWKNICVSTLTKMESAKAVAALELRWNPNAGPNTMGNPLYRNTVSQYLRDGVRPVCPSGAQCWYNAINELATCQSMLPGHVLPGAP